MIEDMYQAPLLDIGEKHAMRIKDDYASFSGISLGPNVTLVSRDNDIIVVRVGGYKTFMSTAEQAYIPTQYYKMRVGPVIDGYIHTTNVVEVVSSIIPGRNKKVLAHWMAND